MTPPQKPQKNAGSFLTLTAMASRNLTLRDQLRGAELAAKLARESVAELQRERDEGKRHVRHLLICEMLKVSNCSDCIAARDWAAS